MIDSSLINPFFAGAILLILSLIASKVSDRLGVPALLLFLCLGMLAGSDCTGYIYFDNTKLTNDMGTVALAFILFSGGMDTNVKSIRSVLRPGILLSTLGVILTAAFVAIFCHFALGISTEGAMLLGAIISSTDAAAIFSVLRSRGVGLKGKIAPLLEFESGSNDPMAIFITIGVIQCLLPDSRESLSGLGIQLVIQICVGAAIGIGMGKLAEIVFNRINLDYEGLYPVLGISFAMLAYGTADLFHGNGFLAVYLCGLILGDSDFLYKRHVARFHDGLAWLMQIAMFLMLGLLVFPSKIPAVADEGLIIALFLMFVARPLAVFICIPDRSFSFREKLLIGWAGLKGAVPIILATYPLMYKFPQADLLFNVVFFLVITSVLLQGKTLMFVAKLLKLEQNAPPQPHSPIEINRTRDTKFEIREIDISLKSPLCGKKISALTLPEDTRILLIRRQRDFIIPKGGSSIEPDDTLTLYGPPEQLKTAAGLAQDTIEDSAGTRE